MIVVHHLNNSRSQRVLWLLEELGLEYEIKRYERDPKTMLAPASLLAVHPLGKSPVITDDALTLAESGAIVEYLVERYGKGKLAPAPGTPERLRYTYWLHYAEGSAMPPLLLKLVFNRIANGPMPFFAKPVAKGISQRVLDDVRRPPDQAASRLHGGGTREEPLVRRQRILGGRHPVEFSARGSRSAGGARRRARPKLMAYLDRIHARPAYRRALERGGEYSLLS